MENIVKMSKIPKCDFCKEQALYDGRTVTGVWAYMCSKHYMSYGVGLGVGKGQRIMLDDCCLFCGEQIPQGKQVCTKCERR